MARLPSMPWIQGDLSSDPLPGAKGSEQKPSARAWVLLLLLLALSPLGGPPGAAAYFPDIWKIS